MAGLNLIYKGAEAELYRGKWLGFDVVFKRRVAKAYRNPDLDRYIRVTRTSLEAKLLSDARRLGVPTPIVYMVDSVRTEIAMSYIDGQPLKKLVPAMDHDAVIQAFIAVGEAVGMLHAGGMVHGDLTTSNIIVKDGAIFLIDMGLGEYTPSVEARGVDLHLMRRALESSHFDSSVSAYAGFTKGYSDVMGAEARLVLNRVGDIRRRGRYVDGGRCMLE